MAALNRRPAPPTPLRALACAAVVAVAGALLACAPRPPTVEVLLVGGSVVDDAGGQVEVERGGTATPAHRGQELQPGDLVRTGPDGQAVLRLEDGKVEVIVFEDTEVRVGSIFVALGKVIVRVLKKVQDEFEVESEYAVAAAEGTEFLVEIRPGGDYRCAVIDGLVEVRSTKGEWAAAALSRGEEATGRPGRAVSERGLDAKEFNGLVEQVNAVERAVRRISARLVVPDVRGFDERAAGRALAAAGLEPGSSEGRVTGRAPVGTVLDQSPRPGSRLTGGGGVDLVVEAEPTTVPRVAGLSLEEAEARLAAARLRTGTVRREITGSRPPGEVLRQQPAAGGEAAIGSGVDLWVEAPSVVVPSVLEVDARRAAAVLRRTGLQARAETRLVEGVAGGTVLAQRPEPGTPVAPGTVVELIVAERGVRVPDLSGGSERTLAAVLDRHGLALGQVSSRPERRPPGTVLGQRPAAGSLVRAGTPVDVVLAAHCTVPDLRRKTLDEAQAALAEARLVGSVAQFTAEPGTGEGYFPESSAPQDRRVVAQEPKAGTPVECGSSVTITLR